MTQLIHASSSCLHHPILATGNSGCSLPQLELDTHCRYNLPICDHEHSRIGQRAERLRDGVIWLPLALTVLLLAQIVSAELLSTTR